MSKLKGNRADSKELQELIKANPSANITTEVEKHNAHCYNIIGASTRKGKGVSYILDWRSFVLTKEDYVKATKDGKEALNANNYGFEQLFIYHDPTKTDPKEKEPKE